MGKRKTKQRMPTEETTAARERVHDSHASASTSVQKEALEIERLQLELSWSKGWRRYIDRLISPATLAALAVVATTAIGVLTWKRQRDEEQLLQLQRDLLVPGLTRSSAGRILAYGDRANAVVWQTITTPDSALLPAALAMIELLGDSVRRDSTIIARYFNPLLSPGTNPRVGASDAVSMQSVVAALEALYQPRWIDSSKAFPKQTGDLVTPELQFLEWQRVWLTERGPLRSIIDSANRRLVVPEGYFADTLSQIAWLPAFWVRTPRMSAQDSARLHAVLDSTEIDSLPNLVMLRGEAIGLGAIAGVAARRIPPFARSGNPTVTSDSSRYVVTLSTRFLVGFVDSGRVETQEDRRRMEWKARRGQYGNRWSNMLMYVPESMQQLVYTRYPNGHSRLILPFP